MSVIFDDKQKIFYLNTPKTSYIFGLFRDKFLVHLYWGEKLLDMPVFEKAFPGYLCHEDRLFHCPGAIGSQLFRSHPKRGLGTLYKDLEEEKE